MTKEDTSRYDIIIVGAGVVGTTLAKLVAQSEANRSLSIALIDQSGPPCMPDLTAEQPEFDARVLALAPYSVNLMKSIGVWDDIFNQRACSYHHMTVWDHEGTGQIEFDARDLHQPELGIIVENAILLSKILQQLTSDCRVDIMHQQEVTAIDDVIISDANTNRSDVTYDKRLTLNSGKQLQAKLIIAADGGQSRIRELINMTTNAWPCDQTAIVTSVQTEHSHQATAWQNFLVTGPLAFLPLGDPSQRYCSIVWSLDTDRAKTIMQLPDQEFMNVLSTAFEHRLGKVQAVSKRYSFPLLQRHATNYFVPQIVLAGDAAHTVHPLAGQGVNLGLRDAQALAKEISRASTHKICLRDTSILRRYQRQRKRHNMEIALLMKAFKQLFGSRDLGVRWLRNSGLSTVNQLKPVKNWLAKQAIGLS